MRIFALALAIGVSALAGSAQAQCNYPNVFSSGSVASAAAVNANFSALSNSCAPLASPAFTGVVTFSPSGSEAGRFGTDGSFLVGTTTNGGWTGNARAEVKNDSAQAFSAWMNGSGTAIQARVDNTSSNLISFYYTGGAQVGSLLTDGSDLRVNSTNTGYLALGGGNYYLWSVPAFYPASDNARTLGTSSFRWSEVFAANGTINTSDRREKSKIRPIEKARDIVMSVEAKAFTKYGMDRMGFIAQDVRVSLEKYGVGRDTVRGNEAVEKLGLYEADMIAPLWNATRGVIEQVNRQDREIQYLKRENQILFRQVRDLLTAVVALENANGQRLDKHAEARRVRVNR